MIAPFHPSIADPILGEAGQRERLAEAINGPLFVADLLLNRGIKDKETARAFFLALPPEPNAMKPEAPMLGLETALDALVQAHAAGQRIVIHGDYDVDGVTATALLYLGLRSMGFPCGWFIPNRFADGYGITRGSIDKIRAETTHIIISVDTGIAACEEVAYAKSQGIDVIITDHHQAGPEIPQALAILNPNQPGCPYPNKGLSGVGVAYTLLCALSERLPGCQPEDYLDLVALGSLADNVPVTGANRAIIRNGLRRISQTRSPGVHALFHKTGVAADSLSTMDVLFKITPLLNAMGRMGSPEISLRLLISADSIEAERHLASMVEQNNLRRQIDQAITEEAIHRIENDPSLRHAACLVVGDATWHEGVIGIVAARLVEKYGRPAFVLAIDKEGRAKGSGRTVTGFHLHRAIGTVPHLFEKWGGHYYACGFTLKAECGDTFRQAMEALATTYLGEATGPAPVQPAAWMPLGELDESSMTWLRRFEPFGPLNESPLFCAEDVDLHDKPRIVGEKHLKFSVAQNGGVFDAIAFNMGHRAAAMEGLKSLKRIAFHPEWNIFRGRRRIQLRVVAFE
jgi:single-stranded-DNA-specific exonuclease